MATFIARLLAGAPGCAAALVLRHGRLKKYMMRHYISSGTKILEGRYARANQSGVVFDEAVAQNPPILTNSCSHPLILGEV